jgi:hypothetical protein
VFCRGGLEQRGHECQKQPSMNTATLAVRKTKSGCPGRGRCRRQPEMLAPRTRDANRSSVLPLPRERMDAMILERFSGDSSTRTKLYRIDGRSVCGYAVPPAGGFLYRQDLACNEPSDRGSYCIANESPSSTVHPSGNPISVSHSSQVKFLAT